MQLHDLNSIFVNGNLKRALTLVTPVLVNYYVAILGSLLFLLYINDLFQAVASGSLHIADGTCIVFQSKNVIEIKKTTN